MNESQANPSSPPWRWPKIASRIAGILLIAFLIGWTLNRISAVLDRSHRPAGFIRGMVQGALMPLAIPNLLVGKDVTIYSQNNTGVTYKLGYTAGVNVCGIVFIGGFVWRLSRWRRANGKR